MHLTNRARLPGQLDITKWVRLCLPWSTITPDDAPELGTHGRGWWDRAWGSPSATQWRDEDVPTVVRRARLEDLFYASPKAWVASEVRHLDSTLGLTPESRARLRWRIDEGPGEQSQPAEPRPCGELRDRLKVLGP